MHPEVMHVGTLLLALAQNIVTMGGQSLQMCLMEGRRWCQEWVLVIPIATISSAAAVCSVYVPLCVQGLDVLLSAPDGE